MFELEWTAHFKAIIFYPVMRSISCYQNQRFFELASSGTGELGEGATASTER